MPNALADAGGALDVAAGVDKEAPAGADDVAGAAVEAAAAG